MRKEGSKFGWEKDGYCLFLPSYFSNFKYSYYPMFLIIIFLLISYLHILLTYIPITYKWVPIYFSIRLSYLSGLSLFHHWLFSYFPASYFPTSLLVYLLSFLLPIFQVTYFPTCLLSYLQTSIILFLLFLHKFLKYLST